MRAVDTAIDADTGKDPRAPKATVQSAEPRGPGVDEIWPGQEHVAADCELETVRALVDAAQPGDRVTLPACEVWWEDGLELDKAIMFTGAGKDQTILHMGFADYYGALLWLLVPTEGRLRVAHLRLDGDRHEGNGMYVYGGTEGQVQVDNVRFEEIDGRAAHTSGLFEGLFFDNQVVDCRLTFDTYATSLMTESWAAPLRLGTTQMMVYEDNAIEYRDWYPDAAAATASHGHGGRSTWRHNTWHNTNEGLDFYPIFDAHGNQQPVKGQQAEVEPPAGEGDHRGTRHVEFYNNTFLNEAGSSSGVRITDLRGGTILIYGNTYDGDGMSGSMYIREEDGDARFDYLQTYPGHDQHRVFAWDNLSNGSAIESWYGQDDDCSTFIQEGMNLFFRAPTAGDITGDYTPLEYPHPWRSNG